MNLNSIKLKLAVFVVSLSATVSAQALSAFIDNDKLVVTIMADCSFLGARLIVDDFCSSQRLTRNYAPYCKVTVVQTSARIGCGKNPELKPQVISVPLNKTNIAHEASEIEFFWQNKTFKLIR